MRDWMDRLFLENRIAIWLIALLVVAGAVLFRFMLARLGARWAGSRRRKPGTSFSAAVQALLPSLRLGLVTLSLWIVLHPPLLTFSEPAGAIIDRVLETLFAIWICITLAGLGNVFVNLYQRRTAETDSSNQRATLINFYRRVVQVLAFIAGVYLVLRIWGFDLTGLITGLGIGGLALSLAAQDTMSNLIGGLVVMFDRFFKIGDIISTPDIEGVVEEIGIRSSKIRTYDQAIVTVPNGRLSNTYVTNYSRMGKRRIRLTISLKPGYSSEQIETFMEALRERIKQRPQVFAENVLVCAEKMTLTSLDLLVQCFIRQIDFASFLIERQAILLIVQDLLAEQQLAVATMTALIPPQPGI